ncbi:MAG: FHA domain-containing protein [Xenococcaceae cyanobacterium MO_167.B52]|nr:FHA domain-containing protein [Xenococcaceae cyanobacterium MO_167.B52]
MAIVKCMNPQCDYFERAVPEGDCCPYCGEPLNMESSSYQEPDSYYPPVEPPRQYEPISSSPPGYGNAPAPIRTVVEVPTASLKLIHATCGEVFVIDQNSAMNKMYLGRQDGIPSERPVIDVSTVPFAERVSRLHAYVTWDNYTNSFTIVDDNSTNGTILNNQTLTPQQSYPLKTGDRLEFGREHKVIFRIEIS